MTLGSTFFYHYVDAGNVFKMEKLYIVIKISLLFYHQTSSWMRRLKFGSLVLKTGQSDQGQNPGLLSQSDMG